MSVTLVGLPRQIPMSVYEETIEAVRERYQHIPGVTDVIEYGTIPHPGISDTDFIVVIEPGAEVDIPSLKTYTKDQQYVMGSIPFIISAETLPQLRLIDPFLVNFTPLLGRTPYTLKSFHPLSEEELRFFSLEFSFLSWILPWFEFFARVECLQELPCRYFLESIKQSPRAFRELHRAGLIDAPIDPNADLYQALTNEWFEIDERDRSRRVMDVLKKNLASTKQYISILRKGLQQRTLIYKTDERHTIKRTTHKNAICYDFGSEAYIFQKGREHIEVDFTRTHSPFNAQTYQRALVFLPFECSAILNRLLFESGHFPDFIRRHTSTDLAEIPVFTHPTLEKKTQLINQTLEDLKNVRGGKFLGQTYGCRIHAQPTGGSLRARLGGAYDRSIPTLAQGAFGRLFKKDHLRTKL
ncbi:hypothetical protein HYZ98_04925 [Candidatus Peregrinibacteria bacterium]|nr:hypothetical protein [Candidatus Peregrinibacteria bacterium]